MPRASVGVSPVAPVARFATRDGATGDNLLARVRARACPSSPARCDGWPSRCSPTRPARPARPSWSWPSAAAPRRRPSPGSAGRWASRATPTCGSAIAGETGRAARAAGWTVDIGREIQPSDPLRAGARPDHGRRHPGHARHRRAARPRARSSGPPRPSPAPTGSTSTAPAAARWSARRCSSACTASASPPGPGPTCTTGWPAPRCWRRRRGAGHLAQRADPRDHRDARRGGQPGRHHHRADQLPSLAAGRARRHRAAHGDQATTFRPDALSARHPQLVVLDLLYIAVAQRTHDRAHAAFQRTAQAVAGHRSPISREATA